MPAAPSPNDVQMLAKQQAASRTLGESSGLTRRANQAAAELTQIALDETLESPVLYREHLAATLRLLADYFARPLPHVD